MQNKNIQTLIYRNYLKSSLIPIFVIELTLLLLYFGINYYISDRNRTTLLNEATANIREIASREVASINRQLMEVNDLAVIMQRDHQAFFTNPEACYFPHGEPQFQTHANGAFFKPVNNGGSSLYYAKTTIMGETEQRKARCSEMLDPLLASIVDTSAIVTQAYLNTWDDMNRLYPFMPDAPGQYGPAINMEDYNFYYDADAEHNPQRKPVWTGAYLDPAGQGWMISLIVPVYAGDKLEGVSGLDVTIDSFVQNILTLHFPWNAAIFMVDSTGTILAMPPRVEDILQLKELRAHDYSENIIQTIEKPEDFNLLKTPHPVLRNQFAQLFQSRDRIGSLNIDGTEYLVSQEIVQETGWRMMTLIETSKVFAPITELKKLSNNVGLFAVAVMVIFYGVFFAFLMVSSRKLTDRISLPIIKLSSLTKGLGKNLQSEQLALTGIEEVDTLTQNFHTMSQELSLAMGEARAARQEADSVIANFLDSLLVVDADLKVTRVNRETCLLLDYSEQELVGRSVTELFDEPDELVAGYFNFPFQPETLEKSELRNVELTLTIGHGDGLPVSINLARVDNEQGETVGVVAGAKDVSDLKTALQESEHQKQVIQNILNTVPGGLLVIDDDLELVQANTIYLKLISQWCQQYGFEEPVLRASLRTAINDQLASKPVGIVHLQGRHDEIIIEYHASSGGSLGTLGNRVLFLHDVTARYKADAIQKLQATVLGQTTEGVVVTNIHGTIEFVNLAAETMSGYSQAELYGSKPSMFRSGIQDEAFYQHMWDTLTQGQVWTGAVTNRSKNGDLYEVEMTISPVRGMENEITHYVSLWRDVSQIRHLQGQLLQIQKLEAVGQLAAGIAHEINTPIQYIQNNLDFFQGSFDAMLPLLKTLQQALDKPELLQNQEWGQTLTTQIEECELGFLYDEIPAAITDSLAGIEHVARIVAAMKEFAHPGQGGKVATNLNQLIDNAAVVTKNAWKYNAVLDTDLDKELPVVECDPGSISQVLLNLIINAADAIGETGQEGVQGHIGIKTRLVDKQVEISISDDGVGIPADLRDRIFEPFFTTKDVNKGSGQGLAIVYDIIVNKHHGQILCDSERGKGTTMTLILPLEENPA